MSTELLAEPLKKHLNDLVPPRPPEMQKMEAYAANNDFPIIGPACGYLCYQIARMLRAQRIFELGSGYGYSTAWFARAVQKNGGGKVFHVVWDSRLSQMARTHLNTLGFSDLIEYRVSEAVEALGATPGLFDLIFNDIDKDAYPQALPMITKKLRPGGVMIVDNMLWQGRIFDADNRAASTEGVRELTRLVTSDPTWAASIIPIRDGMLVAYKQA